MIAVVLLLGGCGGGKQTASPIDPTPDPTMPLPESNIPRGIGVDPPGGGPVVPPGPDPDAPVILDVTINRTPLPANAWADLHAVSNVSLVSHAWHLGPNAVTRSYSTFASLPIKTLQPGLQRGWVEGWDAQGRHAMREFELEVARTEPTFIGIHTSKYEVAVGEEFEVQAILEGDCSDLSWRFDWEYLEVVDAPIETNTRTVRLRALRPGNCGVTMVGDRDFDYEEGEWTSQARSVHLRVAGPPLLIYKHQHAPLLAGAGTRGDMRWMAYGNPDAYEWDFGLGATQLPYGPLNLYLQFNEAGLYTGQARAHNIDGWSDWQSVPYAVGRNWTKTGAWSGRSKRAFAVAQGRLWVAEFQWVSNAPGILTIKSTDAALPFDAGADWDEVSWSLPKRHSLAGAIDGFGRPMFVLDQGGARGLVAPVTSDPQGVDDWWMRSILDSQNYNFSQFAGSPQRLAVLAGRRRGVGPDNRLYDLPLGMLLASEAPLALFDGAMLPALESNQRADRLLPLAMPEGVGWIEHEHGSSESRVTVSSNGTTTQYTLALPTQEKGYWIGGVKADGRFFLSAIPCGWASDSYPATPSAGALYRTGTSLPLQASDWESLSYPEHLKHTMSSPTTHPGSEYIWIGGLGIPADAPSNAFPNPSQWTPVSHRAAGNLIAPEFAFGGRLYQLQVLYYGSHHQDHEVWSVSLE